MSNSDTKQPWEPSASRNVAQARAQMLRCIREFFYTRQVLEVETPLLCNHSVSDPYIDSFAVKTSTDQTRYLQSSPEYAMKRLLAADYGSIYQICKAFRAEEVGHLHHPEFSMLEWYQLNYTQDDLMQEVADLLQHLLPGVSIQFSTYQELFINHLELDPFAASLEQLLSCLQTHHIEVPSDLERDDLLNLIISNIIEAQLPQGVVFIHHYPASQAALAMLDPQPPHHALRFEVYLDGVELANGFQELRDAEQQHSRFARNNQQREHMNKSSINIDPHLIAALQHGLPPCSGVALGLDRLLKNITGVTILSEVISFNWLNA